MQYNLCSRLFYNWSPLIIFLFFLYISFPTIPKGQKRQKKEKIQIFRSCIIDWPQLYDRVSHYKLRFTIRKVSRFIKDIETSEKIELHRWKIRKGTTKFAGTEKSQLKTLESHVKNSQGLTYNYNCKMMEI